MSSFLQGSVRLRVALVALAAGLLSAMGFLPWARAVAEGADAGEPAGLWLAGVGELLGLGVWALGGAVVAGDRGRLAVGPAAATGALAAGVSACLVGLPAVEVHALSELWRTTSAGSSGPDVLTGVLGRSVLSLLVWAGLGAWLQLAVGAMAGAGGAALRAPRDGRLDVPEGPDLLWPLLLARMVVLLSIVGAAAGDQLAQSLPGAQGLLMANGALSGALGAAILAATGVGHLRQARWPFRALAVLYGLGMSISALLWVAVPLLWPSLRSVPTLVVWLALPALATAAGAWWGWRSGPAPVPRWRGLVDEAALLAVIATVLIVGPGLLSVGLAAALLPVSWIEALAGQAPYPSPEGPVRELFWMHVRYAPLVVVASIPATVTLLAPLTAAMRWALRRTGPVPDRADPARRSTG